MTSLCRHLSAQEIVNWVTTADGCVHTADADATKQFRPFGVGGVYWALKTELFDQMYSWSPPPPFHALSTRVFWYNFNFCSVFLQQLAV